MDNNVILRQLRYIFDFSDDQMIDLFAQAEVVVSRSEICNWLKKEDQEDYQIFTDPQLATFLNGFINKKRGKKEGPQPPPEERLNNNIIFRKLKIALSFKDSDIMDTFKLADLDISKHEISALFRHPSKGQYQPCKDQFLRNFLFGLQLKYRQNRK